MPIHALIIGTLRFAYPMQHWSVLFSHVPNAKMRAESGASNQWYIQNTVFMGYL